MLLVKSILKMPLAQYYCPDSKCFSWKSGLRIFLRTKPNSMNTNRKCRQFLNQCLLLILICTAGCSKKEGNSTPFLKAESPKLLKSDINGCKLLNGQAASMFYYSIPYKASSGTVIKKVEITSFYSNGATFNSHFNTSFDGTDGNIEHNVCVRFGTSTWGKYAFTLISEDGRKSNSSETTLSKPAGAP